MRTFPSLAAIILLSGATADALGQTLEIPGTDGGAGAIQNPGAGLPGTGWQPLFEGTGDPDADLIFEVPITLESIPRAIRIGGTGPLMTPNQLIVTCTAYASPEAGASGLPGLGDLGAALEAANDDNAASPEPGAEESGEIRMPTAGNVSFPSTSLEPGSPLDMLRMFGGTASIPLSEIEPGVERLVSISVDPPESLRGVLDIWNCGMAIWRSSEASACPLGACALPDAENSYGVPRATYQPHPSNQSQLTTEGTLPAIP